MPSWSARALSKFTQERANHANGFKRQKGQATVNVESTGYQYVLTDHEVPFWDHDDESLRTWFRREIRHKVFDLARAQESNDWTIRHPDETVLENGAVG